MPKAKRLVTGDMTVQEIVELYPTTVEILAEWGLGCSACHIGAIETIEEGAFAHGFTQEEVDEIIHDLNETAIREKAMEEEASK
jgi:hybrid cluster-associated redox disulfide protein